MGIENKIVGNVLKFETQIDLEKLEQFRNVHDPHISAFSPAAVKSDYTVFFTPTSIGTIAQIRCRCQIQEDITDYSNW